MERMMQSPIDRRALRHKLWLARGFEPPQRPQVVSSHPIDRRALRNHLKSVRAALKAVQTGFACSALEDRALFCQFDSDRLLQMKYLSWFLDEGGMRGRDTLKAYVWAFLDEPIYWQFQTDQGWADCDEVTQQALRKAEAQGEHVVELRLRSWTYEYNLAERCQTNLSTLKYRSLRRRNPFVAKFAGSRESGPTTCEGPRWQFSSGFGWADCDVEVQNLLKEAEAQGNFSVQARVRQYDYVFDLKLGKQLNVSTGRERNLRCIGSSRPMAK